MRYWYQFYNPNTYHNSYVLEKWHVDIVEEPKFSAYTFTIVYSKRFFDLAQENLHHIEIVDPIIIGLLDHGLYSDCKKLFEKLVIKNVLLVCK